YEFYAKIAERVAGGNPLLSGIIGDAWAGNVEIGPIDSPAQVERLGYSHGATADRSFSRLQSGSDLRDAYFEENCEKLADPRWRIIEAMRMKLIMLSYLIRVPAHLGFSPWSPFLEMDVALSMLNLPSERREKRRWQREFFMRENIDFENHGLTHTLENTLNRDAMCRVPLVPLDVILLREVVEPSYVEWINREVCRHACYFRLRDLLIRSRNGLFAIPKLNGLLWKAGLRDVEDKLMVPYFAYMTLWPIQWLIMRRNMA
ncbi:MAG: hypothetical protein HQ518_07865, partial [Rhodopirellula sp.]|nr:hypothetical protein [Rhodopirellula sp.]